MEDRVLSALLDLRIAIGELQGALVDIDLACSKLMVVQLDALQSKNTPMPTPAPEAHKRGAHECGPPC